MPFIKHILKRNSKVFFFFFTLFSLLAVFLTCMYQSLIHLFIHQIFPKELLLAIIGRIKKKNLGPWKAPNLVAKAKHTCARTHTMTKCTILNLCHLINILLKGKNIFFSISEI